MSAARGMTENRYLSRYPMRLVRMHISAYLKDKFLVVRSLMPGINAALGGKGGAPVRASSKSMIPDWYMDRHHDGSRQYQVYDLEAPLSSLVEVAQTSGLNKRPGSRITGAHG